jgi:hypothetical protein
MTIREKLVASEWAGLVGIMCGIKRQKAMQRKPQRKRKQKPTPALTKDREKERKKLLQENGIYIYSEEQIKTNKLKPSASSNF